MARREVIQFFDDLDNTPLTQEEVTIIKFAVNGTNYIIDLSEKNADKFHEALAPFIKAARKDTVSSRRSNNSLIQNWSANGLPPTELPWPPVAKFHRRLSRSTWILTRDTQVPAPTLPRTCGNAPRVCRRCAPGGFHRRLGQLERKTDNPV